MKDKFIPEYYTIVKDRAQSIVEEIITNHCDGNLANICTDTYNTVKTEAESRFQQIVDNNCTYMQDKVDTLTTSIDMATNKKSETPSATQPFTFFDPKAP